MLALALAFLSLRAFAQESQSQEPPPQEPSSPSDPAVADPASEEASAPEDEKLSIEEMKALSDADLRAVYLEAPWKLPEDFGDDPELLDRVMSLAHPEIEPGSESLEHPESTEPQETAETTPKPKSKPDAR